MVVERRGDDVGADHGEGSDDVDDEEGDDDDDDDEEDVYDG